VIKDERSLPDSRCVTDCGTEKVVLIAFLRLV